MSNPTNPQGEPMKTTRKKAKRIANGTQKRPNRGKGNGTKTGPSKV